MKQVTGLEDPRREHLPSFNKHAHSYIELLPPPNHSQHPEGPYSSPYSYSDLRKRVHQKRKIREYSPNKRDLVLALIDCMGAHGELYITNKGLSEKTGISTATIERNIKQLEDEGVIKCEHFMPTPTSYRRQMIFCWKTLMIPHTIKMMDNPILKSSSVFSSSSLKDLKDTKYPLEACPSDKPLASSEPKAPRLPISFEEFLGDGNSYLNSSEYSTSRFLNDKPSEIETIPAASVVVLKDYASIQEQKMNKSPVLSVIEKMKKDKEDKERDERERIEARDSAIARREKGQKEDASVFTKGKARQERLSQLETLYPNWQEVCDREECSLDELKYRMWNNYQYEPFDEDTSNFNPFTHPKYGFMSEEEKDKEFIRIVNHWIYPVPYRHSARNVNLFHRARLRADLLQIPYDHWIIAIYWGVGERNMRYSHINSKYGESYYDRWIAAGKPIPRNTGASLENVLQHENMMAWKRNKSKWKRRDSYEIVSEKVDPIIKSFAIEYAATCAAKRARA